MDNNSTQYYIFRNGVLTHNEDKCISEKLNRFVNKIIEKRNQNGNKVTENRLNRIGVYLETYHCLQDFNYLNTLWEDWCD